MTQEEFGLFLRSSNEIRRRVCHGRTLILRSRENPDGSVSLVCSVEQGARFEGLVFLEKARSLIATGLLIDRRRRGFRINKEMKQPSEDGLLDFVCSLLAFEYSFPPDAGVTLDEFQIADDL